MVVSHSVRAALSTASHKAPASPVVLGRSWRPRRSSCGYFLRHERAVSGQCNLMHRGAHTCGVRTGWQPRGQWCVDRRLSCDTDTRHDVSAGSSCSRRSAQWQQQHVRAVALAPPGGLLQTWTDGHVAAGCSRWSRGHCCEQKSKFKNRSATRHAEWSWRHAMSSSTLAANLGEPQVI